MIIYRGEYKDIETNLANTNIQVTKRIDIVDANNPYNIAYTSVIVGPNIEFTFTFGPTLPPGAFGTSIGYSSDGGLTWSASTGGIISPRVITLPYAGWIFQFVFFTPTGNIFFNFEDTIIPIELTDNPCRIVIIDNDEDKFTPIRAKQADIEIYSSDTISINTFSQGADDRFKVNYYVNDVLHFTGFLSLGDLSQEFLPDPNVIKLIAVDGLGFLNDIPLIDFEGDNPENENSILQYLQWALSNTGLQLNLAVTFNIREQTASTLNSDASGTGHMFRMCFLDAKTFEAEIGECENCYSVISKIIGEEGFLFQHLGEWRIIRIDEMEYGINQNVYTWRWDGVFIDRVVETSEKNIGIGEAYSWMNDDALVLIERLVKESRLTYKYEIPLEIPCNVDFERGDLITTVSPTDKHYDVECWDKLFSNTSSDDPVTTGIYIRRIFLDDYEKERYVVIEASAQFKFIMSGSIPVSAKDKFTLGVQRRLSSDVGGSGFFRDNHVQVRLYGDDGTFWTHQSPTSASDERKWVACNSIFRTNQKYFSIEGDVSADLTEAISLYNGESAEIPVNGYLRILLYCSALYGSTVNTYLTCSFDYLPFINGSYQKYTGQKHTVAQTVATRNIRDKQVYISDSPKRLFKGALLTATKGAIIYTDNTDFFTDRFNVPGNRTTTFYPGRPFYIDFTTSNNGFFRVVLSTYNSGDNTTDVIVNETLVDEQNASASFYVVTFPLAGLFFNAAQEPDAPVNLKPYGEIQAFDVWNQYNRTMVKFDGTVDHSNPAPDMVNKYFMTDVNNNTTGRIFLLLHYELDTHLCEWQAFFIEVSNENIFKQYTGNSFKYLTK